MALQAVRSAAYVVAMLALANDSAAADRHATHVETRHASGSIADHRVQWPGWRHVVRVITLEDYNTRVVFAGTSLLGVVGGVVGTFMLLRKRALVGDVVSHASLPGIAAAFIAMEIVRPGSGKTLWGLLTGALAAGLAGMACVMAIRKLARLKEDAALAIVLSTFFGLGIALFTVLQDIPSGNVAGLSGFIFGKAASIVADDVKLIAVASMVVLLISILLFKEMSLLCFDEGYAASQGWPVTGLDAILMLLVACVTVIGLQSVGLLLVVAMLIIPAVAARFWTDRLESMAVAAALIGGLSAAGGVLVSAMFPRLAAGAVIVLVGCLCFVASMLAGRRHGILRRAWLHWRMKAQVDRQHLLRAMYEQLEAKASRGLPWVVPEQGQVSLDELMSERSWTRHRLRELLAHAEREGLIHAGPGRRYTLTHAGLEQARRVARNHRLWELYLMTYADVAASRVDRYADMIEHVLEPEILGELDQTLTRKYPHLAPMPQSPHVIGQPAA